MPALPWGGPSCSVVTLFTRSARTGRMAVTTLPKPLPYSGRGLGVGAKRTCVYLQSPQPPFAKGGLICASVESVSAGCSSQRSPVLGPSRPSPSGAPRGCAALTALRAGLLERLIHQPLRGHYYEQAYCEQCRRISLSH